MKPTFNDVLNGSAHIIADGDCLRANVPAMFSDDPDAPMATVVLEAAIRQRYHRFRVSLDD